METGKTLGLADQPNLVGELQATERLSPNNGGQLLIMTLET